MTTSHRNISLNFSTLPLTCNSKYQIKTSDRKSKDTCMERKTMPQISFNSRFYGGYLCLEDIKNK